MPKRRLAIFGMVPIAFLQDPQTSEREIRTYCALMSFQGQREDCFPSLPEIARRAGQNEKSCRRALVTLSAREWVSKIRRGFGKTNVYCCMWPDATDVDNSDPQEWTTGVQSVMDSLLSNQNGQHVSNHLKEQVKENPKRSDDRDRSSPLDAAPVAQIPPELAGPLAELGATLAQAKRWTH